MRITRATRTAPPTRISAGGASGAEGYALLGVLRGRSDDALCVVGSGGEDVGVSARSLDVTFTPMRLLKVSSSWRCQLTKRQIISEPDPASRERRCGAGPVLRGSEFGHRCREQDEDEDRPFRTLSEDTCVGHRMSPAAPVGRPKRRQPLTRCRTCNSFADWEMADPTVSPQAPSGPDSAVGKYSVRGCRKFSSHHCPTIAVASPLGSPHRYLTCVGRPRTTAAQKIVRPKDLRSSMTVEQFIADLDEWVDAHTRRAEQDSLMNTEALVVAGLAQ
jgi:hypothetical protein